MNYKGIFAVLGGVLVMMSASSFLIWSNIAVYVLSYLYLYDKDINVNAIFYVDLTVVLLISVG